MKKLLTPILLFIACATVTGQKYKGDAYYCPDVAKPDSMEWKAGKCYLNGLYYGPAEYHHRDIRIKKVYKFIMKNPEGKTELWTITDTAVTISKPGVERRLKVDMHPFIFMDTTDMFVVLMECDDGYSMGFTYSKILEKYIVLIWDAPGDKKNIYTIEEEIN